MELYIRNHPDEVAQPWWDRFEATLVQRYVGTNALQKHIEDRRSKLEAHGALLQWDKGSGLPYLNFKNEQDLLLFVLKY